MCMHVICINVCMPKYMFGSCMNLDIVMHPRSSLLLLMQPTKANTLRISFLGGVPRQFVYGHFVYDTSSTDILSTDISSTAVYQGTGQLYIQLLFQQIIIFINSNFHLHYDSLYQSHFH